jgi:hypothetical protein
MIAPPGKSIRKMSGDFKADSRDYVPGPATNRMLSIHTGKKLDSPYVKLPPMEGLFLCKTPQLIALNKNLIKKDSE